MRSLTLALGLAALLAGGAGPTVAQERPLAFGTSGLSVSLELADLDGRPLAQAPIDTPFRMHIGFSGPAERNLAPTAWLRRAGEGAATCQDSARAVRVTGRLGAEDVPLAGLAVVTIDRANRVAIVDPARPASSRIVAGIVDLGESPGDSVVHAERGELLVSRANQSDVLALPLPWGKPRTLASGLARPTTLLPAQAGRLWLATRDRVLLLDRSGANLHAENVPDGARLLDAGPARVLIAGPNGEGRLLDRATGATRATFPAGSIGAVAAATRDAILTTHADRLVRLFGDSPDRPEILDVPGPITAIRTDAAGRWAIAASRDADDGHQLHLVDLVTGRRAFGFAAPEPFDEAVLTESAVFLTWPSRPLVTVIDLAALGRGGDAAIRDVRLNAAAEPGGATRSGAMMVSLAPLSAVAVMRPGGRTLHMVLAGGGLTSAPVQAIELKGDAPVAIAAYPRSLVAMGDGRFEATARLPRGGRWELVATTGIGGTTACLPVATTPVPEPPPEPALIATILAREADGASLSVSLRDWPGPLPRHGLRLRLAALDGSDVVEVDAAWAEIDYRTARLPLRPIAYAISLRDGPARPAPAVVDLSGAPAMRTSGAAPP